MRKIKLVHIIGGLNYGGAEKLLLDLVHKTDKTKFTISVVTLKGGGALEEKFTAAGVKVVTIDKKFKGNLRVIKRIEAYLIKTKPQIVHTHLFSGDFYGGVAALLANVPVIVSTKHDVLSESRLRDFLGRKLRKKFTKIIAISNATRDYLIKEEKIPYEKVQVIYNGVDVSKFFIEKPDILTDNNVTIGTVGRLSKEKGQKHLLRACRFIRDPNWNLLLVGDGPMRSELERSVSMLDLDEHVTFVGEVEDVRPYLEKIDIFVLPSVSEGLSLAVIEAALAGRFVIATDVGGVPEVINDQETGILFKPKHIEQLVKDLNWVMENKEQSRKMALRLQKETMEKFDINIVVKQYQALYNELVHQR